MDSPLRVCGAGEMNFPTILLVAIVIPNILSFAATLWLNKISDYVNLFKQTKTLFWCIETDPVVHRSGLFAAVRSEKVEDFETLTEIVSVGNKETVINRPDRNGDTALHMACKIKFPEKVSLLLQNGASQQPGRDADLPPDQLR